VRDEESKRVLEEVGVERPIEVVADPALLLTPEPISAEALLSDGVDTSGRLIAMSVREPGRAAPDLAVDAYHATLAAVADFAVHRYGGQVVFVPMERGDVRESHAVLARMTAPEQARVLHGAYGPREILGLMHHMDLAVGMRLHFLIFAALSDVPFLPLPYAGKVADFARTLGIPIPGSLHRDAVGPLLAAVDRLWDERLANAGRARGRIEKLKPRAAATLQHVLDLLPPPSRAASGTESGHTDQGGVPHAAADPAGSRGAVDTAPALSVARS
jgi:polysaccharide pyruvyl transferase WcaK-like protein